MKEGRKMVLTELKIHQKAVVTKVNIANALLKRRILDMGITSGVVIEIKKIAPLGDPIDISLRGYQLCLRKNELSQIECEVIK